MTEALKTVPFLQTKRQELFSQQKTVGFVPTMGALHDGHISLIKRSLDENDITIVSLFVNPTQFNNTSDFEKYPVTYEKDLKVLSELGVDYLFAPEYETLYPDNYRYKIVENKSSHSLCGAHRPGHFDGVLTVVMKLLNLIRPNKAYFGEKDYQQYELVKDMVNSFFLDTEIIPCPTVRGEDGLALSSRNQRLSPKARTLAPKFHETMKSNLSNDEISKRLQKCGFDVDYVENRDGRRYGAVSLEGVRLIDNVPL